MSASDFLLGIHNFKGRSEDELDIQRGEYIAVLEDDSEFNDSWYFGHNLTTNLSGLFPKSFTAPVTDLPHELKRRKADLDALNASNTSEEALSSSGRDFGSNSVDTSQSLMADNSGVSYEHTPKMYQGFSGQDPTPAVPRQQPEVKQPSLSKLSIQDPCSPSTDLSITGPDSASSVEPGFETPVTTESPDTKVSFYEQPAPQMSQASDIDAAISEMNKSRGSHTQAYSGTPRSGSQLSSRLNGPPSGTPNPALTLSPVMNSVLSWTPQQVESYFAAKGLVEDAPKFVQHRITGAILLELDRDTLKEIDIVSFGPRFEIDREIRNLRQAIGFTPTGSPTSPGTPMSTQSYNAMLASPMANNSMNSIMNTPIASQGNYFMPPSQNGASTSTLNAASQNYLPPPRQPQQQASFPQNQLPYASRSSQTMRSNSGGQPVDGYTQPTGNSYRGSPGNGAPQGSHSQGAYSQGLQQKKSNSQGTYHQGSHPQGSYPQGSYPQGSYAQGGQQQSNHATPQPKTNGVAYQKYGEQSQLPYPQSQPMSITGDQRKGSGGSPAKLKSSSEEEITGSLSSNFSLKANGAAMAAAQAAEKGHHRRSSSATSRYSAVPSHRRTRTLEDWESSLLPTISKEEQSSRKGHSRHASRGSILSMYRNSQSQGKNAHSRNASVDSAKQKRRSSMLSLLSGSPKKSNQGASVMESPRIGSPNGTQNSVPSMKDTPASSNSGNSKRSSSENNTLKSLMRPGLIKQKTSAFQEGIQNINAEMAAASAEKSGWMHKRGGTSIGVWSKRFFTLHGTRLSYFTNFKDSKERGLIDITGHRVTMVKDHEILVNLSAAGMGAGRHCFKLVPPGPGYKKGVAFTAPKVHYFAVESAEEMRQWQSALMSATIERDESIPVESTCKLPTISLSKAQELMAERLKTKGDIGSLTR